MPQNAVLETIKTRRSVRAFQPRQVEEEKLDLVLEAGTYAPTGRGAQSPVIVSVQDPETIRALRAMNADVMGVETDPYYGAPAIVLVFADASRGTWVQDGSCVLENMMLAAHALGLGSCWINREREMFETARGRALMERWGLSEKLAGVGALALGYPDGGLPRAARRKEGYIVKVPYQKEP